MANYTHLSSISVKGSIRTSLQGKLIGTFDTMPEASSQNEGLTVLYTGPTGTYVQGRYYVSDGVNWSLSAANAQGPPGETGPAGPQGPKGDDGVTPVRGVDYWTEEDRRGIIDDVLASLPAAEGGSF